MWLLWMGVGLVLLRWFEIGPFGGLSWWWVLAPLAGAAVWFESLERLFGLDKRRVDAVAHEKRRKDRVAEQFHQHKTRR
jgi:small Trp-rich protein